jgi:hypothetical protein
MKLYRSILLDQDEDINTENIGNSWTLCEIFAEDHAKDINRHLGKDGIVILSTNVSEDMIDMDNSLFAMENRDHEYEVVINGNITCSIHSVQGIDFDQDQIITGETGSNDFEDYTNNYEGDLTAENLLSLALEF